MPVFVGSGVFGMNMTANGQQLVHRSLRRFNGAQVNNADLGHIPPSKIPEVDVPQANAALATGQYRTHTPDRLKRLGP